MRKFGGAAINTDGRGLPALIIMKMSWPGGGCNRNAASICPEAGSRQMGTVFCCLVEHLGDEAGEAGNRPAAWAQVGVIGRCNGRLGRDRAGPT